MDTLALGLLVTLFMTPLVVAAEADTVVARVNQHEIYLSEVRASIESLVLGDQVDTPSTAFPSAPVDWHPQKYDS